MHPVIINYSLHVMLYCSCVYNNFHPSAPPQPVVQTLSQETGTEYSLESDYEPSDHSSLTKSIRQGDFTNILTKRVWNRSRVCVCVSVCQRSYG